MKFLRFIMGSVVPISQIDFIINYIWSIDHFVVAGIFIYIYVDGFSGVNQPR